MDRYPCNRRTPASGLAHWNLPAAHQQPIPQRFVRVLAPLLAGWLLPAVTSAQTHWDLTPYRVRVVVAVAPVPELNAGMKANLLAELVEHADLVLGATWDLEVQEAAAQLRCQILHEIATLPADLFQGDWDRRDKVLVTGINPVAGGYRITVRDFDCQTRFWSSPTVRVVRQVAMLAPAVFRAVLETFAPLARIEFDRDQQVVLRPRAGGLPVRDPTFRLIAQGDVLVPIIRRNDREGNPMVDGIQPVPWTFLTVQEVGPAGIRCTPHSGLRNPLRVRVRGRVEQLALLIRVSPAPTRLMLRDRAPGHQPLAGYDVLARDPGAEATVFLGRTDHAGAINIEPGRSRLRILYVRNGATLQARLPIVPGWQATAVADLPDDRMRLSTEGFLVGLQDDLVDLVARRAILIARVRQQMEAGDLDAAKKQLDELQRLPNRQGLLQLVAQQQQRSVSNDPQVRARIEQIFDKTKQLLVNYLDPGPINQLQSDYDRARREHGTGG
ncbi:MAG: hypothetical protein A2W31_11390 [Planctomycetes bacterium RBG_16_64_10]|nr:MAG: hypothetical protein A2W31_11390 [Planctomycetes bacterium RBG_16_64_10]